MKDEVWRLGEIEGGSDGKASEDIDDDGIDVQYREWNGEGKAGSGLSETLQCQLFFPLKIITRTRTSHAKP